MVTRTSSVSIFLLSVLLLPIILAQKADNGDDDDDPIKLNFDIKSKNVHHLEIEWEIQHDNETVLTDIAPFKTVTRKITGDFRILSPLLSNGSTGTYDIQDLMPEAEYEICLKSVISAENMDGDKVANGMPLSKCLVFATVAFVRDDSLIALFAVLAYVVTLIVIGTLCWYCAKRKMEAGEGEDEEEEKLVDANDEAYAPGTKSSIEDDDIPYITPPISELSKEERLSKDAVNTPV